MTETMTRKPVAIRPFELSRQTSKLCASVRKAVAEHAKAEEAAIAAGTLVRISTDRDAELLKLNAHLSEVKEASTLLKKTVQVLASVQNVLDKGEAAPSDLAELSIVKSAVLLRKASEKIGDFSESEELSERIQGLGMVAVNTLKRTQSLEAKNKLNVAETRAFAKMIRLSVSAQFGGKQPAACSEYREAKSAYHEATNLRRKSASTGTRTEQ